MLEAQSKALAKMQTDWRNVPVTDVKAQIIASETVKCLAAIHVTKGLIRNAELLDCYFEMADLKSRPSMKWGAKRIAVKCLWYGRKPPTSWMHIAVVGGYEIISDYFGAVVRDIGRK